MIDAAKLMVEVGADTKDAERGIDSVHDKLNKAARGMTSAGLGMSAAVTAPLVAVAAAVFNVGSSFESAFTGVIKTVNATDEQIAGLRAGILGMSMEIPVSASAIANIAAAAGQLGIETDNILDFTRVMADLGVTTNLSADEAATSLARFANITGMAQTNFGRLGSTIVALGNNLATTEAEIVAMGMRIAGAGSQIGLTEAQIMGLAGALSSVGIEAEAGGSAISRVMIDMANAVATGNDELTLMAQVAGLTNAQFSELFKTNPADALIGFIEGLNGISAAGGNVFGVLEQLGFGEIRVRDALLRASGAGDLFRQSLELATDAWRENVALSNEAALRYGTVESQLQLMANGLSLVGITLYDRVRPMITETIAAVNEGIGSLIGMAQSISPSMLNAALAFVGVFAAAGPLLLVMGGLAAALGFLISPLGLVITATAALAAAWAADFGGIQSKTASVLSSVQAWFISTAAGAQTLASSVKTAFSNTSFPSLQTLWEQFKVGDFQTVADTIRSTAFDLMVNLDTELSISAQARSLDAELRRRSNLVDQFAADAIAGWTDSMTNIDWSGLSLNTANIVSAVSLGLKTVDWSGLTSLFLTGFNSATPKDPSAFQLATDNFGAAIRQAFMDIQWGDLGLSFLSLTLSITNSIVSMREALDDAVTTAMIGFFAGIRDRALGFFSGSSFQFDPVITKGPDPILSQQKNLLNPLSNAASTMFAEFYAAFTASAASTARQMVASVGSFFTDLGTSFLTGIASLGTQLKDAIGGMLSKLNPFAGDETAGGKKGKYSLRPPVSDQPDIGAFDWVDFIAPLEWPSFISILRWETFVERVDWGGFIDNVEWSSLIPDISWGDWVPSLDWTRFVPAFAAPASAFASGTNYAPGGMALVGERGPEIIDLPRGSRVYNAQTSAAMMGGDVHIHVHADAIRSDMDIHSTAAKLAREFQRRIR